MAEYFQNGDSIWDMVRKILTNLYTVLINGIPFNESPSSSEVVTGSDVIVATAGTRVQFPSAVCTRGVFVVAKSGNTGPVYLGGSTVTKGSGSNRGMTLTQAGMPSQIIPVDNANKLYLNADNNNDGVGFIAI